MTNNKMKKWWGILKATVQEFLQDKPFVYSSSIAYFAIFSLPAIAILTVMIAGSVYENESVRSEMLAQISQLGGKNSAMEIERLMDKIDRPSDGGFTKIASIGALLFSATTVFVILQNSLNAIWNIKSKPEKGIVKFLVNRLLSLAMIGSLGFLLLISLVADTFIALFRNFINEYLSGFVYQFVWLINTAVSTIVILLMFALIYKVLPDAKIRWKYVWVGALITTILFVFGKYLIGFYLSNSDFTESYGAAGSLVALLVWVYYSVVILLFGAEFTYVYTLYTGGKIIPSNQAVAIKIEEIEREDVTSADP